MDIDLSLRSRRVGIVAILTAACIASNYLLIGVFNVKFMDLIVFVTGFTFGSYTGASVGILTWLVYGVLNPFGFSLPILAATSIGECIYGIVGGVIGSKNSKMVSGGLLSNGKFAVIGFLLTFFYDLFTNVISGLTVGIPLSIALVAGIPFSLAHELSNTFFFFIGASYLISAIKRVFHRGFGDV